MEHPAEPSDGDKVSVWRLKCHRTWCMKLRQAHCHRVDQWLFGAKGIKPTCLRALNLGPPEVVGRELLRGTEPWRTRPVQGLKGRGSDGCYRTAQAKEYPSALCRSIIIATLRGIRYRILAEGTRDPFSLEPSLNHWLQHMLCQSQVLALDTFLPDYQGA